MTENIIPLGTEYGKHYVNPDLLNKESIVYSFGVGEDISYDLELIQRVGCSIWGFDPTPKAIEYIKNNEPPNFTFFNYGISDIDGNLSFDPPANPNHASYKACANGQVILPVKKLSTILKELNHKHINVLKLDIEGSEFAVVDNILKEEIFPEQMSIEFHGTTSYITNWIKNNSLLKEKYQGYAYPNNTDMFLDTCFIRKDIM